MNRRLFIWAGCLLIFASCDKEIGLEAPAVNVTTVSNSVKVGENAVFLFDGNADMISFYSGELYNEFEFRDRRSIDIAAQPRYVQFTSSVQGGSQQNQLSVWASIDFQEDYTYAGVNKATWIDITDRFTWGTDATFLNSSLQDITGISDVNKPLYFAFRYITEPQLEKGDSRLWYIQNFQVMSGATLGDAMLPIVNQEYAGFRIVEQDPENAQTRSSVSSTRVSFQGYAYKLPTDPIFDPENPIFDPKNPIYDPESPLFNIDAKLPVFVPYDPNDPYNDPPTETWAVSAPIQLKEIELGPDKSIPIKGVDGGILTQFMHAYKNPGTYKAHFVISNNNIYGSKDVVREVPVVVTP